MGVADRLRDQSKSGGDLSFSEKQEVLVEIQFVRGKVEEKARPRHLRDIVTPEIRFETRQIGNMLGLVVGKEISWLGLRRIFDKDFNKFKDFVFESFFNTNPKLKWNKFCVSRTAESRFEQDDKLIYFELKDGEKKNPRVIFLGIGKPLGDVQVYCGYAAESLGYEFLGLGKEKRRKFDAENR